MPSSLKPPTGGNSILAAVSAMRSMAGGDVQAAYDQMYHSNPQFRAFADSMQGKTPEQAFREHGLDYSQVQGLIR